MNPYRIVKETDDAITYEYQTVHTWILYGGIILSGVGFLLKVEPLMILGWVVVLIPFFSRLTVGAKPTKDIKEALKKGSVEFSGSKYSFSNPIRITIKKA